MAGKKNDKQDLRKLPKDKRPKPTSGQSAPERQLHFDELSDAEKDIVKMLGRKRVARTVEYLADAFDGDNPKLQVRNALRRIVCAGWVDRIGRGQYQLSKNGADRLRRL